MATGTAGAAAAAAPAASRTGVPATPAATAAGAAVTAATATSPAARGAAVRSATKSEEAAGVAAPLPATAAPNTATAAEATAESAAESAEETAEEAAAAGYRTNMEGAVAVPLLSRSASSSSVAAASSAAKEERKPISAAAAAAAPTKRGSAVAGPAAPAVKIKPITVVAEHFSLSIRSSTHIPCLPAVAAALRKGGAMAEAGFSRTQQQGGAGVDDRPYRYELDEEEDNDQEEEEKACTRRGGFARSCKKGRHCYETTQREKAGFLPRRTRQSASLTAPAAYIGEEEAVPATRGTEENKGGRATSPSSRAAVAGAPTAGAPAAGGAAATQACPGKPLASFLQRQPTPQQHLPSAGAGTAAAAAAADRSHPACPPGGGRKGDVKTASGKRCCAARAGSEADEEEGGKRDAAVRSSSGRKLTVETAETGSGAPGDGDGTEGGTFKTILKDITLYAPPGQLLVIMGPSGSGKTTLLNALAGRSPPSSRVLHEGGLYYLGLPREEPLSSYVTYVMQKDRIPEFLTVNDYMTFYARLKMKDSPKEERRRRVREVLHELGLWKSRHTLVGGSMRKGLSGGEIKRLAVAVELLHNPSVIFLDEPTSGLDAALAFETMKLLLRLAKQGSRTIICTIHQPRSQLFAMFDRLILLYDGRVVFQGSAHRCVPYFASHGFCCPAAFNPADFLLDLLSVAPLTALPLACPQSSRSLSVQAELEQQLQQIHSLNSKSVPVNRRTSRNSRSSRSSSAGSRKESRSKNSKSSHDAAVPTAVVGLTPLPRLRTSPAPHEADGRGATTAAAESVAFAAAAVGAEAQPLPDAVAAKTTAAAAAGGGRRRTAGREGLDEAAAAGESDAQAAAAAARGEREKRRRGREGREEAERRGESTTQPPEGRNREEMRESDAEDNSREGKRRSLLQWLAAGGRPERLGKADSSRPAVHGGEPKEKMTTQEASRKSRSSEKYGSGSRAGSLVSIRTVSRRRQRRSSAASTTRRRAEEKTPETAATAGTAADAERAKGIHKGEEDEEEEERRAEEAAGGRTANQRGLRKESAGAAAAEVFCYREGCTAEVDEERRKDKSVETGGGEEDAATAEEEEEEEAGVHRALVDEREVQMLAVYYAESTEAKDIEEEVRQCVRRSKGKGHVRELGKEPRAVAFKRMFRSRTWGDYLEETWVLLQVNWLSLLRNPLTTLVQLSLNLTLGIVIGVIFFNIPGRGYTVETARNAFGVIFFFTSQGGFGPLDCLSLFCEDRELFNRDTANGNYRPLSFFVAKSVANLPFQHVPITLLLTIAYWMCGLHPDASRFFVFLCIAELCVFASTSFLSCISCASPRVSVTHAVAPILLIILQAVTGYYVRIEDIPAWVAWLRYVSFFHYTYAAMASNQFRLGETWGNLSSEFLLRSTGGVANTSMAFNMTMLATLGVVYRIFAFLLLKYTNRNIGLEA